MFKSQIIQILRGYDCDTIGLDKHKEEREKVCRIQEALQEKIGDDAQLKKLLFDLNKAQNDLNSADVEEFYREGFKLGARLAMEICGVECEED